MRKMRLIGIALCVLLLAPAFSGSIGGQAVDETDFFACWVADNEGNKVVKLDADGSVICQFSINDNAAMKEPVTLAVNPEDGSCWIACTLENTIFKLSSQCEQKIYLHGGDIHPDKEVNPSSPCIDESGDCWFVLSWIKHIAKFDQDDGTRVRTEKVTDISTSAFPIAMAIDRCRYKIWVAEAAFSGSGSISRFTYFDPTNDKDVWVLDGRWQGFKPAWVDVDENSGCCWVADQGNNRVAKISLTGDISYLDGFNEPSCVSVDSINQYVWVADKGNNQVVKLSFDTESSLKRSTSSGLLSTPLAVEADPTYGTCWVSDTGNDRVVKLDSRCNLLQEKSGFNYPSGLALDMGTEQHVSASPMATAYNNARKLIWDPSTGLHLVYTTGPGPGMVTYSKSTDQGDRWFEVNQRLLWGGSPALDVDSSGQPCIAENWAGFGNGFGAKRRESLCVWFKYDDISSFEVLYDCPSMVAGSQNKLHIAISCSARTGTGSEVRYYIANPNSISGPESVHQTNSGTCQFASIVLDSSQTPHVIWQQDGVIYHKKRGTNGWPTTPTQISSAGAQACNPSFTTSSSSGELYAVWQETTPTSQVMFAAYNMSNGTWSSATAVGTVSANAEAYPQIVSRDGFICAVWADLVSGAYEIFYSKKTGSSWSTSANISNSSVKSQYPQAAIAVQENQHHLCVVWTEGNGSPYKIQTYSRSLGKEEEGIIFKEKPEKDAGTPGAILILAMVLFILIGSHMRKRNPHFTVERK